MTLAWSRFTKARGISMGQDLVTVSRQQLLYRIMRSQAVQPEFHVQAQLDDPVSPASAKRTNEQQLACCLPIFRQPA